MTVFESSHLAHQIPLATIGRHLIRAMLDNTPR